MIPAIYSAIDLSALPAPSVIDTPDFQAILAERLAQFQLFAPDYTVLLESDPAVKVHQSLSYQEVILRERINYAVGQSLLPLANGANLDQVAAFYNVARLVVQAANPDTIPPLQLIMENDDAFRYRVQTRIMAWSVGGTAEHYRYWAMSADPRVLDAVAYSPDMGNGFNMGGQVIVAVMSAVGNHVPTDDLVAAVNTALTDTAVKILSDILIVQPATPISFNVQATIRLQPNTPKAVFDGLNAALLAAFNKIQGLGTDVTLSWLMSILQVAGVYDVQLVQPVASVVVAPNQFPTIGTLSLTFGGYANGEGFDVSALETNNAMRTIYQEYIAFCVTNKRTAAQILADLPVSDTTGLLRASLQGLFNFLGLPDGTDSTGAWIKPDELAFLIQIYLATNYYGS